VEPSDAGKTPADADVTPSVELPPVKPVELPTPSADEEFRRHVARLYSPQIRELLDEATRIRSEAGPGASPVDIRLQVQQKLAEADKLRAEANEYLLSLGGEAVEKLKGAMLDDSVDVRRGAAWYLFENVNPGDPQMVAVFVRALEDEDPLVRRLGVAGLKGLPSQALEQFLPQLVALLKEGKERATDRAAIALLIGRIGPRAVAALPVLTRLAREDADAEVRKQSLYAASRIGGDSEAAALFQAALVDPDEDIRKMAVLRLGGLGATASPAVPSLVKSLDDESAVVRKYAAQSLGRLALHASSATGPLAKALGDPDEQVRRAAAQSLVTIGQPSVDPLVAQLKAADPNTRLLALAALGGLGPVAKPAIPAVRKLLDDQNPQVQTAATTILEVLQK
jgi:HEAT repeat protein